MARQSRVYRGIAYDTSTIERLYLEIVVRDVNLEKTISALIDSARTGNYSDCEVPHDSICGTFIL